MGSAEVAVGSVVVVMVVVFVVLDMVVVKLVDVVADVVAGVSMVVPSDPSSLSELFSFAVEIIEITHLLW